jgi:hypothetical protein
LCWRWEWSCEAVEMELGLEPARPPYPRGVSILHRLWDTRLARHAKASPWARTCAMPQPRAQSVSAAMPTPCHSHANAMSQPCHVTAMPRHSHATPQSRAPTPQSRAPCHSHATSQPCHAITLPCHSVARNPCPPTGATRPPTGAPPPACCSGVPDHRTEKNRYLTNPKTCATLSMTDRDDT